MTAIALPDIRTSLGATLADAQCIYNAYMIILSALILTGGAFGDPFGLGRVISIGIAVFVTTSPLCEIAPTA